MCCQGLMLLFNKIGQVYIFPHDFLFTVHCRNSSMPVTIFFFKIVIINVKKC